MTQPYRVTLQGFSAFERSTLASCFRLAGDRSPAYQEAQTAAETDFFIVDADRPEAVRAVLAVGRVHHGVYIGAHPPDGASAWMARPIDPLHVMRELDAMVAAAAGGKAAPAPDSVWAGFVAGGARATSVGDEHADADADADDDLADTARMPLSPGTPAATAQTATAAGEPAAQRPSLLDAIFFQPDAPASPAATVLPTTTVPPAAGSPPAAAPADGANADATAAPRPPQVDRSTEQPQGRPQTQPQPQPHSHSHSQSQSQSQPQPRSQPQPQPQPQPPATTRAKTPPPAPPLQRPPAASTPDAAAPSVLLVDDSEIALRFLQTRLQRLGLHTESAGTSGQAMELLARKAYDCIFLDVDLGPASELDGLALCHHIKRHPGAAGGRAAPVVVMVSAFHSELDRARGALAGADAYVGKPLDEAALARLLRQQGVALGTV